MKKHKSVFRRIKEAVINFFGNIRIYKGGFVLFGESTYKLKGEDWRTILNLIQPGDIVGLDHSHYVSSFFIKGEFGHVGLYVGDNTVIQMITKGINSVDILTFFRADKAFIVRPVDQSLVKDAINRAYEQLSRKVEYDYDFDRQDKGEFYCTELTDYCYGYVLRNGVSKNKKFIYPDDYLIPSKHFKVIWRSDK